MESTVTIKFNNGSATVYLPEFFPCKESKWRKLKNLIYEDYDHGDEIYDILRTFFKESAEHCEVIIKTSTDSYWRNAQKAADYKAMLEKGKLPNGTPLTKQQVKDCKKFMKMCKDDMKTRVREANKAEKDKAWFESQIGACHE